MGRWQGCGERGQTWRHLCSGSRRVQRSVRADWPDTRFAYDEDRYIILGMVEGYLLYVAYAMSGDVIRIISAREAQPQERRRYHEANL
ncbi:BrnT family toxin [Methylobacterium sp. NEAU 140]|nr:BrnT family toxin [Methylobacterium sp. NEAU 140]MDP4025513.1 BrnT family toxin [Methylobacterium sp. NEAU 140]